MSQSPKVVVIGSIGVVLVVVHLALFVRRCPKTSVDSPIYRRNDGAVAVPRNPHHDPNLQRATNGCLALWPLQSVVRLWLLMVRPRGTAAAAVGLDGTAGQQELPALAHPEPVHVLH